MSKLQSDFTTIEQSKQSCWYAIRYCGYFGLSKQFYKVVNSLKAKCIAIFDPNRIIGGCDAPNHRCLINIPVEEFNRQAAKLDLLIRIEETGFYPKYNEFLKQWESLIDWNKGIPYYDFSKWKKNRCIQYFPKLEE